MATQQPMAIFCSCARVAGLLRLARGAAAAAFCCSAAAGWAAAAWSPPAAASSSAGCAAAAACSAVASGAAAAAAAAGGCCCCLVMCNLYSCGRLSSLQMQRGREPGRGRGVPLSPRTRLEGKQPRRQAPFSTHGPSGHPCAAPMQAPTHPPVLQDEQDLINRGVEALLGDMRQQRGQAVLGKAVHAGDQAVLQGQEGWPEGRQAGRAEWWAPAEGRRPARKQETRCAWFSFLRCTGGG